MAHSLEAVPDFDHHGETGRDARRRGTAMARR
jgi:hypothetical protein